jgi:hypothetical protein
MSITFWRNAVTKLMRIIPSWIAMPNRDKNPIAAEMDSGYPVRKRAQIPPIRAKGTDKS